MWLLKCPSFFSTCVSKMTGTAGQQRGGKETISNFIAPLPVEEQKRIVAKIEGL